MEYKKSQHLATLDLGVPNQIAKGEDKKYEICCDPNSQKKYPMYPNCTCNPENWSAFT